MNAFETLGIAPRLVISEEELREAFREAGKSAHPDAGGGEGEFAALREAMAILSSPSRRLRHWLELRGVDVDVRGSIAPDLMDLFAGVGAVSQRAETVIRKRTDAKSALAKALLEGETQVCRDAVESAISDVETAIGRIGSLFSEMEKASEVDAVECGRFVRDLSFLEKWKAGLRSVYVRLI